jgi:hypothetical protein
MSEPLNVAPKKKRKSGIPSGNAGEYLVMGELLRRGFDAQLADRNTKGYDLLASWKEGPFRRVQVKTVRQQPWYINPTSFQPERINDVTIYVLLGAETNQSSARFFIARNKEVAQHAYYPPGWTNGFVNLKTIVDFENRWKLLED